MVQKLRWTKTVRFWLETLRQQKFLVRTLNEFQILLNYSTGFSSRISPMTKCKLLNFFPIILVLKSSKNSSQTRNSPPSVFLRLMLEKLWKTCPQIKLKLVDSSKRINLNLQLDKNLTLVVRPTIDHSVFYHNYQKYLKRLSMASFMNIWDKESKNWSSDIFHKFNLVHSWILCPICNTSSVSYCLVSERPLQAELFSGMAGRDAGTLISWYDFNGFV